MFNVGETVLYGSEGVCKITEITEKTFGDTAIEYYILTPVFNNRSTFFVPTANSALTAKMHPLLTNSEVMDIIETTEELGSWIESDIERKEYFKEIISGGNIKKIASMLKSLLRHKDEMESIGKKLHKPDEMVFKEAQKILYEEFAMVMDLSKDDVIGILCGKDKK